MAIMINMPIKKAAAVISSICSLLTRTGPTPFHFLHANQLYNNWSYTTSSRFDKIPLHAYFNKCEISLSSG
jgi:hypothetical protein